MGEININVSSGLSSLPSFTSKETYGTELKEKTEESQKNEKPSSIKEGVKPLSEKEKEEMEDSANAIFDALNTGLVLKFHDKSGQWYAIIENKITKEVVKEVPPKYVLDLKARLREMIGFFLDRKI